MGVMPPAPNLSRRSTMPASQILSFRPRTRSQSPDICSLGDAARTFGCDFGQESLAALQKGCSGSQILRVLAYGDSLTAGYHQDGTAFAPYAHSLAEGLETSGIRIQCWTCGLSGLCASEMVDGITQAQLPDTCGRVGKGLEHLLENEGPFDVVLLMAGTNDIGYRHEPHRIFQNIRSLHQACHRRGIPSVVLSVPSNRSVTLGLPAYLARWKSVNCLLEEWAAGGLDREVRLFVDTNEIIPFTEESELWEPDGLHFSAIGSSYLGSQLASYLAPWFLLDAQLSCASAFVSPKKATSRRTDIARRAGHLGVSVLAQTTQARPSSVPASRKKEAPKRDLRTLASPMDAQPFCASAFVSPKQEAPKRARGAGHLGVPQGLLVKA